MIVSIAMALMFAAGPPATQTADQFDLICAGTRTKVLSSKVNGVESFESELRIDLGAKTWCGGNCDRTYDIEGAVTASEITLTDDHEAQFESHTKIDRTTGKFTASDHFTAYDLKSGGYSEGECRRAPFKGMPARMF